MATGSRWRHHVWIGERGPYPDEQTARVATARRARQAPLTPVLVDPVLATLAVLLAAWWFGAWLAGL